MFGLKNIQGNLIYNKVANQPQFFVVLIFKLICNKYFVYYIYNVLRIINSKFLIFCLILILITIDLLENKTIDVCNFTGVISYPKINSNLKPLF